jgi:hypothetical protein
MANDLPPPEPAKLLAAWMEWERGDSTPGRVMADLKKAGLREVLEQLVADAPAPPAT